MADENTKTVEQFGETMKGLTESVAGLKAEMEAQKAVDWDAKIEKAFRDQFEAPDVTKVEQKAPSHLYTYTDARMDVAQGKSYKGLNWGYDTQKRFGEFAQMVAEKDTAAIMKAYGDSPYTLTTSAGGYLVPEEFRAELIRLTYLRSTALQKGRIIPMSTDNLKIPTLATGYSAGWGTINTQIVDSKVVFGTLDLSAEKLVGLSIVPNELLSDSALPVAQIIVNEWAEAFAKKIDEEFFDGDSSDTSNHKFDGWLYASGVEEVKPSAGDDTPTKAELVTEDNLLSMVGKLVEREMVGAEWFMHPSIFSTVRGLTDNSSDTIVRINENYRFDLFGYPVNLVEDMPSSTGTLTNDKSYVAFGNPRNIVIGDRMQFTAASSSDSRFSYDQTEFRGTQRMAIAVALPSSIVKLTAPATA